MVIKAFIKRGLLYPPIARKLVKFAFIMHTQSYKLCGMFSSALEKNGLHPKHRLTRYHDFFLDRIEEGMTVLDIGCGNGALLEDIALKTKATTVGVEMSQSNVEAARARLSDLSNIEIMRADIREYCDNRHFDIVVLSNVLEHIEGRVELLKHIKSQFKPKQFLFRVPMFEREWLVPYKKELGIDWRLDPTHVIEHTVDEFYDELAEAGLRVGETIFKWGEIYAVATTAE